MSDPDDPNNNPENPGESGDDNTPQIPEVIDPDNAFYDDENNLVEYFDSDSGIRFKKNESGEMVPEENEDTSDSGENKPDNTEDPDSDDDSNSEQEKSKDKGNEDQSQYANAADYVLKTFGYSHDEVEMADGIKVKISDLTIEQQNELMAGEFANVKNYYEAKIKDLEETPSTDFKDKNEKEIIEFLRNGGNPVDLAKKILDSTPGAQLNQLSNKEIVKNHLKSQFGDMKDEELNEEVDGMSEEKLQKRADSIKKKLESEGHTLNMTEEQKKQIAEQRKQEEGAFNTEVQNIKEEAGKIETIAGVTITDEIRNYLVEEVTSDNIDEDSAFIKSIDNPKALLELKFWQAYGPDLIKAVAKQQYEKGREEGGKQIRKFSDKPVYQSKSRQTPPKKETKKPNPADGLPENFFKVEEF